jgi:hypothetical protein
MKDASSALHFVNNWNFVRPAWVALQARKPPPLDEEIAANRHQSRERYMQWWTLSFCILQLIDSNLGGRPCTVRTVAAFSCPSTEQGGTAVPPWTSISAGLKAFLTEVFRNFPQPKHVKVRTAPLNMWLSFPSLSYHEYSDWLRAGRARCRSSSPGRVKNVLFSTPSRPALGFTQPRIQWVPGALSPGVKRQGREADHSPPPSAEVKKMWIYTSTPPYAFMA